jgi:ABC-type transport system substrate-binding protein
MYFGPLTDVRVRRALMYAFDRKKDNQIAWAGKAVDTWNPFRKTPYWNGEDPKISYDPKKAQKMLAQLGYSGSKKLDLNMVVIQESGPWKRESEVLQQGFVKAGINAHLQITPSTQWFDLVYTKRTHKGIAVNAGTLPFPWALIANYMMKATLLTPPGKKKSADAPLEAAYNKAFASTQEGPYRAALKTVQHLMLRDATAFHTMMASNQNVAPKNLEGVESTLIGDQRFDGAWLA